MSAPKPSAETLNEEMVRRLVSQGLCTTRIEAAFRAVPRHLFLPDLPLAAAYSQDAIITHRAPSGLPTSSSSMPGIMAVMLEQLDVRRGHRVLEIGAGTGYNAALLAALTGSEGEVTTIDLDETIVREARAHLDAAQYQTVRTALGDGWLGVPEHSPYDRIEATVSVWDLSPAWIAQCSDNGRLLVPLYLAGGEQISVAFQRDGERLRSASVEGCGFMRLRGPHAHPETHLRVHGWDVSLDEPDPARAATLVTLLGVEPRIEPAPAGPPGWRNRLILEEARAIVLTPEDDWQYESRAHGILDAASPSLSFITSPARGRQLFTFGSDAAREALLSRLAGTRGLDLRRLRIDAIPSHTPPPQDGMVLRRPNFQFVLRERPW